MTNKLGLLVLLTFAMPGYCQVNRNISLVVQGNAEFDVLYHRVESTATGAALGGLIGAGIETSIRSSADDKKKAQLVEYVGDLSCKSTLIHALEKKLGDSGFVLLAAPKARKKNVENQPGGLSLEIVLNSCGYKMVDTVTQKVSAFIYFDAILKQADGSLAQIDKQNFFLGRKQYNFEDLVAQNSEIDAELIELLARAGNRLANKIIYLR